MRKFAFDWKSVRPKRSEEPIIIEDKDPARFDTAKYYFIAIVIVVSFIYLWEIAVPNRTYEVEEVKTYTICSERGAIEYYDKVIDKVLIRDGYKDCETYPMQGTWDPEWSCYWSGCKFPYSQSYEDKEFEKLIGIRYFIR